MSLKKYTKEELIGYGKQGWNIIPCKDESDIKDVTGILDKERINNIPGYVTNREGKDIPFVLVLRPLNNEVNGNPVMIVKKSHRGRPKKMQPEQVEQPVKAKRGRPKKEVK